MMKFERNVKKLAELGIAMTAIAALIAGCGGGTSSTSSGSSTTTLSGLVADGYLSGVTVCLDKNSNTVCDSGEPAALTGAGGAYSISGVTAADIAAYPLVAEVPATAVDADTASAVGDAFVLTSPAGHSFVSPLTSIVHQMAQDNPASSVAAVAAQLSADMQIASSVTGFDPMADFVADETSGSATSAVSATAHNFARVVANSMMTNYAVASGVSAAQRGQLHGMLVKMAKQAAQSQGATPNPSSGVLGAEDFNTVRAVLATKLTTGTPTQAVTVNFDVMNGASSVKACEALTINNLQLWDKTPLATSSPAVALPTPVAQATPGQMVDLRFYISNVLLWDASGNAVPLVMTEDATQSKNVALMDFGYNTALAGQPVTCTTTYKTAITGHVVPGTYTGISFTLGVPVRSADLTTKLNHSDPADTVNTPLPLQNLATNWSWQSGRKFTKIEFAPTTPANKPVPTNFMATTPKLNVHIGSVGCGGNPVAGTETACTNPNKLGVKFDAFNAASNKIALDVAALFAESDLTYDGGGPAGCMSGPTDPECAAIFKTMGIGFSGPRAGRTLHGAQAQTIFSVK